LTHPAIVRAFFGGILEHTAGVSRRFTGELFQCCQERFSIFWIDPVLDRHKYRPAFMLDVGSDDRSRPSRAHAPWESGAAAAEQRD